MLECASERLLEKGYKLSLDEWVCLCQEDIDSGVDYLHTEALYTVLCAVSAIMLIDWKVCHVRRIESRFEVCVLCLQLSKAQAQHARWQTLGKTNPDKKRLESEIEDECKSIAWQV